jgi:hypothetical protein
MNSHLRWRSLARAWTLPVTRSMPASKLIREIEMNPPRYDNFHGIDRLVLTVLPIARTPRCSIRERGSVVRRMTNAGRRASGAAGSFHTAWANCCHHHPLRTRGNLV